MSVKSKGIKPVLDGLKMGLSSYSVRGIILFDIIIILLAILNGFNHLKFSIVILTTGFLLALSFIQESINSLIKLSKKKDLLGKASLDTITSAIFIFIVIIVSSMLLMVGGL